MGKKGGPTFIGPKLLRSGLEPAAAAATAGGSPALEVLIAVHGPALCGSERYLDVFAAGRTLRRVHLARSTGTAATAAPEATAALAAKSHGASKVGSPT